MDTNSWPRRERALAATVPGVLGQYRKQMEEDIVREQVPRDYHGQVKDYFKALDER
jgi:hypothetical protein